MDQTGHYSSSPSASEYCPKCIAILVLRRAGMGPEWNPGPVYDGLAGPRTVRSFIEESKKLGLVPRNLEYEAQLPEEGSAPPWIAGHSRPRSKGSDGATESAKAYGLSSERMEAPSAAGLTGSRLPPPPREQVNNANLRPATMQAQIIDDDGKTIGVFYFTRRGKDHPFESGRTGWHAQGKLEIGGKRHQVNLLLVEVKPKGPGEEK